MKILKIYFIIESILILCNPLFSQTKTDSLLSVIKTAKEDTNKVNTLNTLAWELIKTGDYTNGLTYANNAFELTAKITPKTIGIKKGMAKAKNNIGVIYWYQGNYPQALNEYFFALNIYEEVLATPSLREGDRGWVKKGIAASHGNIGIIYMEQGNYPEALKEHFSSLKINEEIGNKKGIAASHNNIGIIYKDQGKLPEALKEYFFALKIEEEIGDKKGIASSHGNIGIIYWEQAERERSPARREQLFNEALKEHFSSLEIREEIGDKNGIAYSHNNIGNIYYYKGNYPQASPTERNQSFGRALKEHFSSLKIREEIGDKKGIANSHINIGSVYIKQNKAGEGKKEYETALKISREIGSKNAIKYSYIGLSEADSALGKTAAIAGNWQQANQYNNSAMAHYKIYIVYRDSIINEENTKKSVQHQMQFEFDKKEAVTKAETEKEKQKQQIIIYSVSAGLFLVLILAVFIYRGYRQKQKVNEIISKQKELVEEKQKEILDSIHYAKRIQTALLTSEKYISRNLRKLQNKK